MQSSQQLLLIDGSSFIFRAFYALPELTAPSGEPTGAIYGVVNMLRQLRKKYPTHHFICVFDSKGSTTRHSIYPQYKANRRETPPQLITQFAEIYKIIEALAIPVVMQSGIEADDIIGSLALLAQQLAYQVIIATGDKDFAQLVNEHIQLINTMSNEFLDIQGVIAKFGVKPAQIVDYLTLIGDKADNIPGVHKCGPKTAVKLLQQYHNLANIIANSHEITGVVGNNLRDILGYLPLAQRLITIDTNIQLTDITIAQLLQQSLEPKAIDYNSLRQCYERLGFKSWLEQLRQEMQAPNKAIPCSSLSVVAEMGTLMTPQNTAQGMLNNHKNQVTAVTPAINAPANWHNITTVYLNSLTAIKELSQRFIEEKATIALLIIANSDITPTYLPLIILNDNFTNYVIVTSPVLCQVTNYVLQDYAAVMPILADLLASDIGKILSHYKLHYKLLTTLGFSLNNVVADLTLAHYIYASRKSHQLKDIYQELAQINILDIMPSKLDKAINPNNDMFTFMEQERQKFYQAEFIANCLALLTPLAHLEQLIVARLTEAEVNLYQNIELKLVPLLVAMENTGIMINRDKFKELHSLMVVQLNSLQDQIYQLANCVFNINSPKQLQDVLFKQLLLPTVGIKKNHNGFSTDEDSLKHLSSNYPIAELLLHYRTLSKLLNTYVSKLPLLADSSGRIHTTFEQAVVASGRLSSREPNLQNIPIKNHWGKEVRQCFIVPADHVFVCVDYSQIELRILAHFCQDQNLLTAFNNDQDIHSATASEIFGQSIDSINQEQRRYAKTINFSLLYGKTVFGLAQELNIDRVSAKTYIDAYFAKYPQVQQFLTMQKQLARENEFVTTLYGRHIYLPNIQHKNKIIREAEERLALNAPMQGSAADIIKIAMLNVDRWLKQQRLQSCILLQIHDELILQVAKSELTTVLTNLPLLMIDNTILTVKLAVTVKVRNSWGDEGEIL